jgi:hypothetical protein
MGSIGTRRFKGVLRTALAAVRRIAPALRGAAMAIALAVLAPGVGDAQLAPLPSSMPSGHTLERDGGARWLYSSGARTEVARLQRVQRSTWTRLGNELGVQLGAELDLRLAVNPEQMQALAPPGRTLPGYATGVAYPAEGLILLSLTEPDSWLRSDIDRVLVHELSHVALHRAVDGRPVPRWLSEGVAIHEAGEHSLERVRILWSGTLRGELIPLARLSQSFPARHGDVSLAYAQSADLVGHLLRGDQGRKRFRALVARLRAGEPFEQAFAAAYRMPLWRVEQQWRNQLAQRFGSWPSILSGLTVVWACAALLLVFGYMRVRKRQRETLKRWAIEEAPVLAMETAPPRPEPPPRSVADDVLDAWGDQQRHDSGVPTIVHEGRSHTLH